MSAWRLSEESEEEVLIPGNVRFSLKADPYTFKTHDLRFLLLCMPHVFIHDHLVLRSYPGSATTTLTRTVAAPELSVHARNGHFWSGLVQGIGPLRGSSGHSRRYITSSLSLSVCITLKNKNNPTNFEGIVHVWHGFIQNGHGQGRAENQRLWSDNY